MLSIPFLKFLLTDLPAGTQCHLPLHILTSVYPPLLPSSTQDVLNVYSLAVKIDSSHCHLCWIWNHQGDTSLALSMRALLEGALTEVTSWVCKLQRLNKEESGSWTPTFSHLCFPTVGTMWGKASWPCQPHSLPCSTCYCQRFCHSDEKNS